MAGKAANKLRLGVIGLGRAWDAHHKPTLDRLRDRFEVTAVLDQVARRAELVAHQIGCRAAEGLDALVHGPDVDAVALLAPQWFGLHPIELAARAGKAIYCALPLVGTPGELERLDTIVRAAGVAFMPEFAPRFQPSTARSRDQVAAAPGQALRIRGQIDLARGDATPQPDPVPGLIDWARFVAQTDVVAVETSIDADPGRGDGSGAEPVRLELITPLTPSNWSLTDPPRPVIALAEARHSVWLEAADAMRSTVGAESPTPAISVGDQLFDQFFRLVRGLDHSAPTWDDALSAARVVAAIRLSVAQHGARVEVARSGSRSAGADPAAGPPA